jgi:hypothetical protein
MKKALVIGVVGSETHENSVRTYFLAVATSGWECHIAEIGSGTPVGNIVTYQDDVAGCVQYAILNGYNAIIRSYTGVWSYKLEWDIAWQSGIPVGHAHGSNTHELLSVPPQLFSAMTFGGGVPNVRSYGFIDFTDIAGDGHTEESWTTATGMGRYVNVLASRNKGIWDARYACLITTGYAWNNNDGYRQIQQADAIAYAGAVPVDPYSPNPPESKWCAGFRF